VWEGTPHREKGGQEQEEHFGVDGGGLYIKNAEEEGLTRILFFEYWYWDCVP